MNRGIIGVGLAFGLAALLLVGLALSIRSIPPAVLAAPPANVASQVWEATADDGEALVDFLVIFVEQADLSASAALPTREARLRYVYDTLREVALRSQAPLRAELDAAGVDYRPFYIVNMLAVRGDRVLVTRLAARPEVARVAANPHVHLVLPAPELDGVRPLAPEGVEWNVARVNADDVWALGYTGQGIVVAGQDTGYEWDHPALINQYRGYDGVTVTHDYNWHDAIHTNDPHTPSGNPCGFDSPIPCDDDSHGTHTMGIMVGDDGAGNQIGVAPGARWIGCRNMEERWGTPATYAECFEFFLAPYPIGRDPFTDGVPSLAPHVINNSWTCPSSEGCAWDTLQAVVENVRAAGIAVVASAGNSGPGCESVREPPAIYDAVFSVGYSGSDDEIAYLSGRGPVTVDGSGRLKPDVTAPGAGVRSSLPGGGYGTKSGTSMAGPHVVGTMALLWSAAPVLIGDVDTTEGVIARTARPRTTTQGCGGDSPDDVPNNVYGWGIVNALEAVQEDIPGLSVIQQAHFDPMLLDTRLTYTLRVSNTGNVTLTATITDMLPTHIVSGETCAGTVVAPGGTLTWTPNITVPRGVWTETVVVTVETGYAGPLTNVVWVTTDEGATGIYTHTLAADLDVVKRAEPDPMLAGERLTYTIYVANTGSVALLATVTDTLPTHILPGETDGGTAILPGEMLTWSLAPMMPGDVWTETVVVTAETGYTGPLTNVVRVTTHGGATGVYTETVLSVMPHLGVTKEANADPVQVGSQLVYTISVTNALDLALSQIVITDAIPVSTTFAWASGEYTQAGGIVTWTARSLAEWETLTATLGVTVGYLAPGARVVNAAYGVRASELGTPVMGAPVTVVVSWPRRYFLPLFVRGWPVGGTLGD